MQIAVRYHSRGGNTKKVAEAIGKAVGTEAKDCSTAITQPVDLLFLGGSVYGFGLDDATKNFVAKLSPADVKKVALFGTSAIVKIGSEEMAKLLKDKGIPILDQNFYCRGAFTVMHRGRPNADDLKRAAEFAQQWQRKYKSTGRRTKWYRLNNRCVSAAALVWVTVQWET